MAFWGRKLRLLRNEHKLSEADMGNILGISRPTYRKIEDNLRELNMEEIDKLSTRFGLPKDYFLSKDEKNITYESKSEAVKVEESQISYERYIKVLENNIELLNARVEDLEAQLRKAKAGAA